MHKVLEVGQIVAGPAAGLMLAELGFDVTKVEQPGVGDITRHLTGTSVGNFAFLNMGKRSVTLDLKSSKGKHAFKRLAQKSDVVIDNLGPDTMRKLGLGYDDLTAVNPEIIYLKIKGFGPGPHSWRKLLDYPAEIESGLAYMNGLEDKPMRLGASVIDMFAATLGIVAILKSIIDREKTGQGCYVEVPLFESAVFLMGQHLASAQVLGRELRPLNTEPFTWGVYDFFETSDERRIFLAVTTDSQWKDFCRAFRFNQLLSSPELGTNAGRYTNRSWLIPEIARVVKSMKLDDVVMLLGKNNIAYGRLNRSLDLLDSDQLKHGDKLAAIVCPGGKKILVPRLPLFFCSRNARPNHAPRNPPTLGQDNGEALGKE